MGDVGIPNTLHGVGDVKTTATLEKGSGGVTDVQDGDPVHVLL